MSICLAHRSSPVELCKERLRCRLSQIDAAAVGKQLHPISLECIQRVRRLSKRRIHIRHRQRGKETEAARMRAHDSRRKFVQLHDSN